MGFDFRGLVFIWEEEEILEGIWCEDIVRGVFIRNRICRFFYVGRSVFRIVRKLFAGFVAGVFVG